MLRIKLQILLVVLFIFARTCNSKNCMFLCFAAEQCEKVVQKTVPSSTKTKITENDVFVIAVVNDDFVRANNLIDKIIADNPDNTYYKYVKSFILLNLGKSEDALALYDKELEKNPQNAEMLACKAHLILVEGNKTQALEMIYEALCANFELSPLVNIKRAQIYDAIDQCDYAFKILSDIDMSKEFAKPNLSFLEFVYSLAYSSIAFNSERYLDARIGIDRLLKKNEKLEDAWFLLAQINSKVSPNDVLECLDKAEKIHSNSLNFLLFKAKFFAWRNDYKSAAHLYDEIIQRKLDLDLNESLRYVTILINSENISKAREVFSEIKVVNKYDIWRKKRIELNLLLAEHKWQEARELVYDLRKNYQSFLTEEENIMLLGAECFCECGLKNNRAIELINECIEEGIFPVGKSKVFNDLLGN